MKSEYFTSGWNSRDPGTSEMKHHSSEKPIFIPRRWCYVNGGVGLLFTPINTEIKIKISTMLKIAKTYWAILC